MRILFLLMMLLLSTCATPAATLPPGSQPPAAASPTPTPTPAIVITHADQAIAAAQQKFPQLQAIKKKQPGTIGASTDITTLEQPDGWNIVFWQGSGDCPAGCINHHYWYVTVKKSGEVMLAGEYVREFNPVANAAQERGQPMWGIPK